MQVSLLSDEHWRKISFFLCLKILTAPVTFYLNWIIFLKWLSKAFITMNASPWYAATACYKYDKLSESASQISVQI